MQVITKTSSDREVTLQATLDELVELYDAVKSGGRSSKKANRIRDDFAELLKASDKDLETILETENKPDGD